MATDDDYGIWMTTEPIDPDPPLWRLVARWIRTELAYWLYWRWTRFCHVHDKAHMPWRHRHCCADQYKHPVVRALIRQIRAEDEP